MNGGVKLRPDIQSSQYVQHFARWRCEFRPIELISQLSDGFGLSRIGMDASAGFRQTQFVCHGDLDFRNQVARVLRDDRRSDDFVRALL